jgi:predicted transcriptional regulator
MGEQVGDLGSAELQVLSALWEIAPATVRQVWEHLNKRGRRLAYTTVLTFLTRLEQKEYVESDKSGLAYVYKASVSRRKVRQSRLKNLIKQLYDGAAGPLVLQLIESQKFSAEEIESLQKLISQMEGKPPRSGRGKSSDDKQGDKS